MKPPDKENLLDQLQGTSSSNLTAGVESVDMLGEQDYEDACRAGNHDLNKNWIAIKKAVHWVLFLSGVALIVIALITLIFLLQAYISDVLKSPVKVKDLLSLLVSTVLISLATLFVDRSTSKK